MLARAMLSPLTLLAETTSRTTYEFGRLQYYSERWHYLLLGVVCAAILAFVVYVYRRDSVELHNLPLVIVVKLKKREDTGELTNEIKGYERKASAGQAQQAPVTDNTPPWKR